MADLLQQALRDHHAGRLDLAEQAYRHILQATPNQADALHLLGVIACQRERYEEAADWIRRAIAVKADAAPFHCNLGEVCRRMGRLGQAAGYLKAAITLQPDYAEAWNNLGLTLQMTGKVEEAVAAFREALRIDPKCVGAYTQLATTLGEKLSDDDAKAMQQLLKEPHLTEGNRASIHSGLARYHDAKGEYAAAGGSAPFLVRPLSDPRKPGNHREPFPDGIGHVDKGRGRWPAQRLSQRRGGRRFGTESAEASGNPCRATLQGCAGPPQGVRFGPSSGSGGRQA